MKHITVNLLDYFWKTGIKPIIERIDTLHKVASTGKYTDLIEKPTALKNPHTLNFTGGVTENYDGSVDKSVRIPSLTNNLLANVSGTALDAVQGKALADELTQINSNLAWQNIDFSTWNARSGMEWVGKYCPATREVRIMFTYNNSSGLENGLTYLNIPDGFRPIGGWQLIGIDIVVHGTYANGAFTKDAVSFPVFVRYLGDGRVEINYAINEPAQRHAGIIMYNY